MIELRIQGRPVEARPGESLLEVVRREGHHVPSLCDHAHLTSYGACRLCLVEVSKGGRPPKLVAACTHPALEGLEVTLDSERVVRVRRLAMELLLAHAPEAAAVVAQARELGLERTRFDRDTEPPDCVLCGLCERVCREVVGAEAISLAGRGGGRRVEPPFADERACIGCGACEALCPTDVLELRRRALERFRLLPGEQRLCRYALMGLLPGALCANDFRCERCETEQVMVDRAGGHPLLAAGGPFVEEGSR